MANDKPNVTSESTQADIAKYVSWANAALALLGSIIPSLEQLARRGMVSPQEQADVQAKYLALKATVEAGPFQGPEWEKAPV